MLCHGKSDCVCTKCAEHKSVDSVDLKLFPKSRLFWTIDHLGKVIPFGGSGRVPAPCPARDPKNLDCPATYVLQPSELLALNEAYDAASTHNPSAVWGTGYPPITPEAPLIDPRTGEPWPGRTMQDQEAAAIQYAHTVLLNWPQAFERFLQAQYPEIIALHQDALWSVGRWASCVTLAQVRLPTAVVDLAQPGLLPLPDRYYYSTCSKPAPEPIKPGSGSEVIERLGREGVLVEREPGSQRLRPETVPQSFDLIVAVGLARSQALAALSQAAEILSAGVSELTAADRAIIQCWIPGTLSEARLRELAELVAGARDALAVAPVRYFSGVADIVPSDPDAGDLRNFANANAPGYTFAFLPGATTPPLRPYNQRYIALLPAWGDPHRFDFRATVLVHEAFHFSDPERFVGHNAEQFYNSFRFQGLVSDLARLRYDRAHVTMFVNGTEGCAGPHLP